ncbi:MAG TPA: hypothetical protein VD694_01670 [Nitrososphaeraceae archaeon]|nr:hypothetical protein [Nitrososphaeraceae archaeon]
MLKRKISENYTNIILEEYYFEMRKKGTSKRKVTGKELSLQDELDIKITTLIELLEAKGFLSKGEFERMTAMRLHEISKARAFEDLDKEI